MKFILLAFMLTVAASSQGEYFAEPVYICADGSPILCPAGAGAPLLTDWDDDGFNDLLVGTFQGGNVRIYKNIGTNEAVVLTYTGCLYAAGEIISVSAY